jgi:hypothetical protein
MDPKVTYTTLMVVNFRASGVTIILRKEFLFVKMEHTSQETGVKIIRRESGI